MVLQAMVLGKHAPPPPTSSLAKDLKQAGNGERLGTQQTLTGTKVGQGIVF